MGDIAPETVKDIVDTICRIYADIRGSKESGQGIGDGSLPLEDDWGVSAQIRQLHARTVKCGDLAVIGHVAVRHARDHEATGNHRSVARQLVASLVADLNMACGQSSLRGVNFIDDYAAAYNTGALGPWRCLLPPQFRDIYAGINPRTVLSPLNFYRTDIMLATASLGKPLVITEQGEGQAELAGFEGARAVLPVDAPSAGGKVYGAGRLPSGAVQDNLVWAIGPEGDGQRHPLVPETEGSLLLSVYDIDFPPGMKQGSIYILGSNPARP